MIFADEGYSNAHNSWEPKEDVNAPVLLTAFYGQNPGAIRKLEMGSLDCSQGTLPLDHKERTRSLRTQPMSIERSQVYIRSARIANERTSMSDDRTPANPTTPPPQSPQNNNETPLTLHQAIESLIQSHRRCQRPEVRLGSLW